MNVAVLALLRPAAEQDEHGIAVFAEVDAIPGSKIDSVLEYAATDAFDIREVPQLQPSKRRRQFCGC